MELILQESVYKEAHRAHVEAKDKFNREVSKLYKVRISGETKHTP